MVADLRFYASSAPLRDDDMSNPPKITTPAAADETTNTGTSPVFPCSTFNLATPFQDVETATAAAEAAGLLKRHPPNYGK